MKALQCLSILLCLHSVMSSAIRHRRDEVSDTIQEINTGRKKLEEKIGRKFEELKYSATLAETLNKLDLCNEQVRNPENGRLGSMDGNENYELMIKLTMAQFEAVITKGNQSEILSSLRQLVNAKIGIFEVMIPYQTQIACKQTKCTDDLAKMGTEYVEKLNEMLGKLLGQQLQGTKIETTMFCLFGPHVNIEWKEIEEIASSQTDSKKTSESAINSHTILSFVMAFLVFLF